MYAAQNRINRSPIAFRIHAPLPLTQRVPFGARTLRMCITRISKRLPLTAIIRRCACTKAEEKGIKDSRRLFFSLLGLAVIMIVILLVMPPQSDAGNQIVSDIIDDSPYVDMDELSLWENGAFSLDNIGGESAVTIDGPEDISDTEDTAEQDSEADVIPSGDEGIAAVYDSPVMSETPLYTVLSDGVWSAVGIATNPNQVYGEDGVFTFDQMYGYRYYVQFFNGNTFNIALVEDEITEETHTYELMDSYYCEGLRNTDGVGYRFYYGADGRLYLCLYYYVGDGSEPDITDFIVFEQKGATVDWNALDAS